MRRNQRMTWAVVALATTSLLLSACSGGSEEAAPAEPATPAPAETSHAMTPNEAGAIMVTAPTNAVEIGFEPTILEAPAGEEFTITFHNEDPGIPHNVQIFEGETPSGKVFWAPKNDALIDGGQSVDYEIPEMEAGTYAFNCYVHPTTMTGTITVS